MPVIYINDTIKPMKNSMALWGVFVLLVIFFPPGAHGAPIRELSVGFATVERGEWILEEVRTQGRTIVMDRVRLEAQGLGEVYTIQFQEGRVLGMGAPNRFFGPYTSGTGRSLAIGDLASTLMAAIIEPEGLRESEYFGFLSRVNRWGIHEGKLELYSTNSDGAEAVLVFLPNWG